MVVGTELEPVFELASFGALLVALVLSGLVLTRFSRDGGLLSPLRERLVLGVPWGTMIVMALVYAIYLSVQGGDEWGGPIVVGFRSWSLWYPQGILFSSFSHSSQGHVIGNLLGTLAFAPIAEYAFSHYPQQRGSQSFGSWRANPFARIAIFVAGVVLVGLAGALLVPGAVIGFSGVVFALAGVAVVRYPVTTVVLLVINDVVGLVFRSLRNPVIEEIGRAHV